MQSPQDALAGLRNEIGRVVVGQQALVDGLLVALLGRGHVLVEGVPGVAKTTAVRTLARVLGLAFGRVQFTPDLLPSDLVGSRVFVPERGSFELHRGPVFTEVLLADEINRAPAKVQSALLEAMQERQVTIADETLPLPAAFFVMATQNSIELEGTYPLPEAQLDRFLLKLRVRYPSEEEEREIVERDAQPEPELEARLDAQGLLALQDAATKVYVAPEVRDYAVALARATREQGEPDPASALARMGDAPLALGASPRASIALVRAARSRALIEGRDYATPHDVKRVAPDALRHRLVLGYEAEADGLTPDAVVEGVLGSVQSP
jgi:MoxR-like ATPase